MQISSHVHAVRIPFTVFAGPVALARFVYAYVISGERVWLVDTGVSGSASALLAAVTAAGRAQRDIVEILLTHSHVDHIGSAKALVDATGARVHAHSAERRWIEDVACQAKERPVPGFQELCGRGVAVDRELSDGQTFQLSPGLHLRVIATPGHSPGGVSFLVEEEGVLIAGDAVPVRDDMPVYDDPMQSARSIAKLRAVRGVRTLASAWAEPCTRSAVETALAQGGQVIADVHQAVRSAAKSPEADAMGFCREVVEALRMPPPFVNPMCLRTFLGHWRVREHALAAALAP